MTMRRVFRTLDRPTGELSANDTWREPLGHSTQYAYQFFGGGWGVWKLMHVDLSSPQQWVFIPFNDYQEMIGERGRMIYKQHHQPTGAKTGSAWLCPNGSFKRVLSRGGAWENVNLGSVHPDEVDHDEQESGAEAQRDGAEVSAGTGESTPGDGDDGQVPGAGETVGGSEDGAVITGFGADPSTGEGAASGDTSQAGSGGPFETAPGDGGVDGTGSPVV